MSSGLTPGADRVPALRITGLTKRFAGVTALDAVDLSVAHGSVHALLGGNGSGKSTLVKVLAAVHPADEGSVQVGGQTFDARHLDPVAVRAAGLRFVHQDLGLFDGLSVAENFAMAEGYPTAVGGRIAWRALHRRVAELLDRYEIAATPDTPIAALRPASRTMVAIARALGGAGDDGRENGEANGAPRELVLVLDEPTASLPEHEVEALLDAIRSRAALGQTIVLISHHLGEVLAVADAVTVLRDGRLAGTLNRREASEAAIVDLIAGRTMGDLRAIAAAPSEPGAERLTLQGVAAGRLEAVDVCVRAGEVVGVAGLLGSGRSTLLRAAFGAQPRRAGSVRIDGAEVDMRDPLAAIKAGVALVPEDRGADAAFSSLDLQDNMSASVIGRYWRRGVMQRRSESRDTSSLMSEFSVKAASSRAPFTSLSGGNQQKAILARWLRRKPKVLLLDEPTQGVDVVARAEIYRLIKDSTTEGCAVLVASSDFDELSILCDRVVVLQGGRITAELHRPDTTAARITELVQIEQTSQQSTHRTSEQTTEPSSQQGAAV